MSEAKFVEFESKEKPDGSVVFVNPQNVQWVKGDAQPGWSVIVGSGGPPGASVRGTPAEVVAKLTGTNFTAGTALGPGVRSYTPQL